MKKIFRLFISSTFDDFKLERAVLQRFVFPEIKNFINKKEISFIPIDLRWGVPTEAQEDQKTMQICLNEVNRSAKEIHPDFLVMIGNRYGWIPLPEKIEAKEFKEIEKYVKDKKLLNKWYKLDEEFKELITKKEDIFQINQNQNQKFEELKYKFLELTNNKLIILDTIDQLEDKEDNLDWLPENFIISVLNDKNYEEDLKYYKILKRLPKIKEYILKPIQEKENIIQIILQKLKNYNRTLTNNQLEYILSRKDSKKSLYLTISIEELKTWKDDKNNPIYHPQKENSKAKLSSTQQALIKEFIQNLYTIHRNDELLVKRTFGYIYASQNHIDEELLLEVLSNDEEVMKRVNNEWHLNINSKLPDAVWARLRGEIINFLKENSKGNIQFFHREFRNTSSDFYNQQVGEKLLVILETLKPTPKVLQAHVHTLAKLNIENKDINLDNDYKRIVKKLKIYKIENKYISILNDTGLEIENEFVNTNLSNGYYITSYNISKLLYMQNNLLIDLYIDSLLNYAIINKRMNNMKKADDLYMEGIKVLEPFYEQNNQKFAKQFFTLLHNRGSLLASYYEISKEVQYAGGAITLYLETLKIRENMETSKENIHLLILTYNNLGNIYKKLWENKYDVNNTSLKVEYYYKKVIKILRDYFSKYPKYFFNDYIRILLNFGVFKFQSYDIEISEEIFKQIISLTNKYKDWKNQEIKEAIQIANQALLQISVITEEYDEIQFKNSINNVVNIYNENFKNYDISDYDEMYNLIKEDNSFKTSFLNWLYSVASISIVANRNKKCDIAHEFSEIFIDCSGIFLDTVKDIRQSYDDINEIYHKCNHIEKSNYINI